MSRTHIKSTIKHHFFVHPSDQLRVRELERKLHLPLPSVIRYCKELQEENILATNIIGSTTFYTADKTSKYFLLEKKLYNLESIHRSGLMDYLKENLHNPVIILFGSYAKGEDEETSDIDLYIETPSKKTINIHPYETILKRPLQIFRETHIKHIANPHLANNIINGIPLNRQLEVFT